MHPLQGFWTKERTELFATSYLPRSSAIDQAIEAFAKDLGLMEYKPSRRSVLAAMNRHMGISPRCIIGRDLLPQQRSPYNAFAASQQGAAAHQAENFAKELAMAQAAARRNQQEQGATQQAVEPLTGPLESSTPLEPHRLAPFTFPPSGTTETFQHQLAELIRRTSDSRPILRVNNAREVAILALSDTHFGTSTANVIRRLQELPKKLNAHLQDREIHSLHLLLLGDIIDGDGIYPAQCWDVDMPVPDQWITAIEHLWEFALQLIQIIPSLTIVGQPGNHGATGSKKSDKHRLSNFDVLAYSALELLAKKTGARIKVSCSQSIDYHIETIAGKRVYIRHKAPPQFSTPARKSKGRGWARIHKFDMMFYAHLHNWGIENMDGAPIFRVGSLRGASDFSDEIGEFDNPSCTLIRFSPADFPEHTATQIIWPNEER